MKYIKLLLIILISNSIIAQGTPKPVESKVVKVTVFPEGAQVIRTGHSAIPSGKSELVFEEVVSDFAKFSGLRWENS